MTANELRQHFKVYLDQIPILAGVNLDVHAMKDELLAGLEKWFRDVNNSGKESLGKNVASHTPSLAGIITISGITTTAVAST